MNNNLIKYEIVRHKFDTGDLVEWHSNSLLGWLIRLRTGSKVNHSSLVVKFEYAGCSERRFVLEANSRGIELHLLSSRLAAHNGQAYWSRLKSKYDDRRFDVLGWSLEKLDTDYDYDSLVKQLFARVSVDGRRYFCSEFYQSALEYAEIIPKQVKAVQPGGFSKFDVLEHEVRIL